MNKLFAAALLIAGLSVGDVERGEAAPLAMPGNLNAAVAQGGGGNHLQEADGWWLAIPLVVGGVILLDRYHHHYYRPRAYRSYYHGCYRRCWWDHGRQRCGNTC